MVLWATARRRLLLFDSRGSVWFAMLRRLLVGLLKGVVVGGAIGALLHFGLGLTQISASWMNYSLYALVAAVVGLIAGQPFWRRGAGVAAILKALFGLGVGAGLYALGSNYVRVPVDGFSLFRLGTEFPHAPLLFAPAVAALYGMFVELDDGGEPPEEKNTGVRVSTVSDGDEDVVPVERSEKSSARRRQ